MRSRRWQRMTIVQNDSRSSTNTLCSERRRRHLQWTARRSASMLHGRSASAASQSMRMCYASSTRSRCSNSGLYFLHRRLAEPSTRSFSDWRDASRTSAKTCSSIPIPVPPLAEQQRIVGLLDEAFAGLATAKANAEKNLQNARALFESHLQSVFTQRGKGWVEKTLGEVCDSSMVTVGKSSSSKNEGGTACSSRRQHSTTRRLRLRPMHFDAPDNYDRRDARTRARRRRRALLPCEGASLGKSAFSNADHRRSADQRHRSGHARTPERWTNDFSTSMSSSSSRYKSAFTASGTAQRQPNHRRRSCEIVAIPFPPLTEQKRIVAKLDALPRRNPTPRPPLRAEARRAGGVEEVAAAPSLHRRTLTESTTIQPAVNDSTSWPGLFWPGWSLACPALERRIPARTRSAHSLSQRHAFGCWRSSCSRSRPRRSQAVRVSWFGVADWFRLVQVPVGVQPDAPDAVKQAGAAGAAAGRKPW